MEFVGTTVEGFEVRVKGRELGAETGAGRGNGNGKLVEGRQKRSFEIEGEEKENVGFFAHKMSGELTREGFLLEINLVLVTGKNGERGDHNQSDEFGKMGEVGEVAPGEKQKVEDQRAS